METISLRTDQEDIPKDEKKFDVEIVETSVRKYGTSIEELKKMIEVNNAQIEFMQNANKDIQLKIDEMESHLN